MTAPDAQRQLTGRTIMVTGGTGGIGYQTARMLARGGARVIITGREADTGETAAATIRQESGAESVTFIQADHATVGGNQDLAEQVRAAVPRLDVLVNNVGGLYPTRWETADGYEATLAMNFVGPYVLTAELLPLLRAGGALPLYQRGIGRLQAVEARPVHRCPVHRTLHQRRRIRPHQIAQRPGQPGVGPPPRRRPHQDERGPPRHVVDTDDPIDDRADHAVLAAHLAADPAAAAPRLPCQGRPAGRLRRLLRADRGLHRPILRGQTHTRPAHRA